MAEPFKNLLNAAVVSDIADHLHRVSASFSRRRFTTLALEGLDALELKDRARHLATALEATLPSDFSAAADVLERSLAPLEPGEDGVTQRTTLHGLAGWAVWPMTEFVTRRGLAHPERALIALHAMTQRFTAEWALRAFIERHPALTFDTLQRWAQDPSAHVRRLVSEGSRPRLPWGQRLTALVDDPTPTLPLLLALQDDASAYVRRSVANHLNDIAKDHPELLADWLETHLPEAGPQRRTLLRHASRSLIKQGHPRVLTLWGVGTALKGNATLALTPKSVRLGDSLQIGVTLRSTATAPQALLVDYAVHHVKANGKTSPKVFKGWKLVLGAGETRRLAKQHSLREITTRTYFAGRHRVELLVNGQTSAESAFTLRTE